MTDRIDDAQTDSSPASSVATETSRSASASTGTAAGGTLVATPAGRSTTLPGRESASSTARNTDSDCSPVSRALSSTFVSVMSAPRTSRSSGRWHPIRRPGVRHGGAGWRRTAARRRLARTPPAAATASQTAAARVATRSLPSRIAHPRAPATSTSARVTTTSPRWNRSAHTGSRTCMTTSPTSGGASSTGSPNSARQDSASATTSSASATASISARSFTVIVTVIGTIPFSRSRAVAPSRT